MPNFINKTEELIGLIDTPDVYSGHGGKTVKVKLTEDGVFFSDILPTYTEYFSVAANSWGVTHNLGKIPSVTILDGNHSGNTIEGAISHTNVNTLIITFNTVVTGTVVCN